MFYLKRKIKRNEAYSVLQKIRITIKATKRKYEEAISKDNSENKNNNK